MSDAEPFAVPYMSVGCPMNPMLPTTENLHRPILNVSLRYRRIDTPFLFPCVVDSGADFCIFPAQFGDQIGIEVRKGKVFETTAIGSKTTVYFHKVAISLYLPGELRSFPCMAAFSYRLESTGVLGRRGFFELFDRIVFYENRSCFELWLE